jgi:phage tail sheath protein FI
MPEYLAPGVYVEEVPSGPVPIEGVSTSTAGFVGLTERGPLTPRLVTSWGDYQSWFGGLTDPATSFLPWAIKGFFDNGGQRMFVARTVIHDEANAGAGAAAAAALDHPTATAGQTVLFTATGPGDWGNRLFIDIAAGSNSTATRPTIRVRILYYRTAPPAPLVNPFDSAEIANANRREPTVSEVYDNLGVTPDSADYFVNFISARSRLIEVEWGDPSLAAGRPDDTTFVPLNSVAGDDGTGTLATADFLGDPSDPPGTRQGLAGLADIDPISILAAPDHANAVALPNAPDRDALRNAVIDQCELLRDRFAVISVEGGEGDVSTINPPRDSSYAAFYAPWIRVSDPRNGATLLVPPVGHVAGVYARTDIERGVHKAPANEVLRGMVTVDINATRKPLEFTFGKREQDILNPRGVNLIRDFRSDRRGIRIYGGRTMSTDGNWRYVNVRRLLLFIEESIDEGTQWVVFEPNDEPLWARVRQSVRNFLLLTWRTGALQGGREEDAFFVRCDRTTMTQADIDAGRLICHIGVAPVKPAEFVIFRIQLNTATD